MTEKKPAARKPAARKPAHHEPEHEQEYQAEESRSDPHQNVGPGNVAAQPDASMGNEVVVDAAQQGGSSRGGEENTNPHPGSEPSNFREHRKAGK